MNRITKKMYCIVSMVLLTCFIFFNYSQTVMAIEETGIVPNAFTWSIDDDVMTLQSEYGNWTATLQNDNCTVYGEKLEPSKVSFDDLFVDENEPLLRWFSEHSTNNLELKVKELYSSPGNDTYMKNITSLVIDEKVEFICNNAFIGASNLKNISVFCKNIDLTNSGIGYYFEGEALKDVTIYGYNGSTAETYANENGFTFIALDEAISTTTTQTTQTTITSTTLTTTIISSEDLQSTSTSTFVATTTSTSLPIGITSTTVTTSKQATTITSKGNFTSNGNANNSKESSSSSPKTGDSFPIVSILTAIGISAVSAVLFMKKRK